jgi:hypothetical protein
MRLRVRSLAAVGALALTLGTTAPAAAQGFPRTEVSGGYQLLEFNAADETLSKATGDLHVHQFMGGVRVNARTRAVVPFGKFLVGGINGSVRGEGSAVANGQTLFATSSSDSSTEFALQAAGGANIMFTDLIGVRGTVGYVRVFGEDEGVNVIRVADGVVFDF